MTYCVAIKVNDARNSLMGFRNLPRFDWEQPVLQQAAQVQQQNQQ